ncbi:MAG: helix-turn-helix domain-containing protein [Methylocella sp.]
MIKFTSILGRYEAAEFSQLEAAEILGVDERTFRRWTRRHKEEGEAGLASAAAWPGVGQAGSGRAPR